MHLADGILTSPAWGVALNILGATGFGVAIHRLRNHRPEKLAWAGTLGAFVLAAQAINLPLVAGVSAHAIGAGLVTLVLGPSAAIVVLGAVLLIQSTLLADGGLTVLGINLLNIAVIPALCMHAVSQLWGRSSAFTAVAGTVVGSFLSSTSLAGLLVLGANSPSYITFPWLIGVQSAAGLVEGLLTWFALRRLRSAAPNLLDSPGDTSVALLSIDEQALADLSPTKSRWSLRWTAVALVLLVALPPLASQSPDALEVVVERLRVNDK